MSRGICEWQGCCEAKEDVPGRVRYCKEHRREAAHDLYAREIDRRRDARQLVTLAQERREQAAARRVVPPGEQVLVMELVTGRA